jgi:hypothetical protein
MLNLWQKNVCNIVSFAANMPFKYGIVVSVVDALAALSAASAYVAFASVNWR